MCPRIFFTVTNDLNFDQRMIRICTTLTQAGYDVTLVGRQMHTSPVLTDQPFHQKRLACFFEKGIVFYAEYNTRLFFYLLQQKMEGICAIDLDTILPCYFSSILKRTRRIYDAHELYCEMKEIISRPLIYKFWKGLEKIILPRFKHGYTVNASIAGEYKKMYGLHYAVVRNLPFRDKVVVAPRKPFIIYQGAVNEGRCFEDLIPAMQQISLPLHVYGDGNFLSQANKLVKQYGLEDKVLFKGKLPPPALKAITREAFLGLNLIENNGLSFYLSLSNRFFDYIQAGLPQVCVDYPAYRQINDEFNVALLVKNCDPGTIAAAVNELIANEEKWNELQGNALRAAAVLNWENEEQILLDLYQNIFGKTH